MSNIDDIDTNSPDYIPPNPEYYNLVLVPDSITEEKTNSFEKMVQLGLVGLSFVVILLHVFIGMSMTHTIFLFVMYGILLLFITYIKNKYIKK